MTSQIREIFLSIKNLFFLLQKLTTLLENKIFEKKLSPMISLVRATRVALSSELLLLTLGEERL